MSISLAFVPNLENLLRTLLVSSLEAKIIKGVAGFILIFTYLTLYVIRTESSGTA